MLSEMLQTIWPGEKSWCHAHLPPELECVIFSYYHFMSKNIILVILVVTIVVITTSSIVDVTIITST